MNPAQPTSQPKASRKTSKDKPLTWSGKILVFLASLLGAVILRAVWFSQRKSFRGEENVKTFWDRGENVIVAFWHDRLILLPFAYRGPKGMRALISSSRDGELIARTVAKLGLGAIRGSSTRGGSEALAALLAALKDGYDVGLTPDGPRGPRHVVKAGVIELARATGRPILPLLMSSKRGKRLRSWDRFLIPLPFDSVVVRWGAPVWADAAGEFEADRARVEKALNDLCLQVDTETGNLE